MSPGPWLLASGGAVPSGGPWPPPSDAAYPPPLDGPWPPLCDAASPPLDAGPAAAGSEGGVGVEVDRGTVPPAGSSGGWAMWARRAIGACGTSPPCAAGLDLPRLDETRPSCAVSVPPWLSPEGVAPPASGPGARDGVPAVAELAELAQLGVSATGARGAVGEGEGAVVLEVGTVRAAPPAAAAAAVPPCTPPIASESHAASPPSTRAARTPLLAPAPAPWPLAPGPSPSPCHVTLARGPGLAPGASAQEGGGGRSRRSSSTLRSGAWPLAPGSCPPSSTLRSGGEKVCQARIAWAQGR